jgi:hypothetical protein
MAGIHWSGEMKHHFQIHLKRDGKLTFFSMLCLLLGGLALTLAALIYSPNKWIMLIGVVLGCLMASVAGISAKAQVLGLSPFTNDPLGWRKAKESYLNKDTEEKLKLSVDVSVEDSKK